MAGDTTSANLQTILEQRCEKVRKPRFTVLFRHGDRASGMFVVLSGKVSVGFGDNSAFDRSYGPGALVGLPSTLTGRNYCMTATVTEDAELAFWSLRRGLVIAQPSRPLPTITGDHGREDG
jgi:CRP-like cAMP-binding protein